MHANKNMEDRNTYQQVSQRNHNMEYEHQKALKPRKLKVVFTIPKQALKKLRARLLKKLRKRSMGSETDNPNEHLDTLEDSESTESQYSRSVSDFSLDSSSLSYSTDGSRVIEEIEVLQAAQERYLLPEILYDGITTDDEHIFMRTSSTRTPYASLDDDAISACSSNEGRPMNCVRSILIGEFDCSHTLRSSQNYLSCSTDGSRNMEENEEFHAATLNLLPVISFEEDAIHEKNLAQPIPTSDTLNSSCTFSSLQNSLLYFTAESRCIEETEKSQVHKRRHLLPVVLFDKDPIYEEHIMLQPLSIIDVFDSPNGSNTFQNSLSYSTDRSQDIEESEELQIAKISHHLPTVSFDTDATNAEDVCMQPLSTRVTQIQDFDMPFLIQCSTLSTEFIEDSENVVFDLDEIDKYSQQFMDGLPCQGHQPPSNHMCVVSNNTVLLCDDDDIVRLISLPGCALVTATPTSLGAREGKKLKTKKAAIYALRCCMLFSLSIGMMIILLFHHRGKTGIDGLLLANNINCELAQVTTELHYDSRIIMHNALSHLAHKLSQVTKVLHHWNIDIDKGLKNHLEHLVKTTWCTTSPPLSSCRHGNRYETFDWVPSKEVSQKFRKTQTFEELLESAMESMMQ